MAAFTSLADSFRTGGASIQRIDPATAAADPRAAQAALTRAQWDLFEKTFQEGEDALLDFARDKTQPDKYAAMAGDDARQAYSLTEGMADRRLSRYGVTMDADQKAVSSRLRGLEQGLSIVGAENNARRGVTDLQTDTLGGMVQIGRGVSAAASEGLAGAASLATSRENANTQIDAQNKAASAQRTQGIISTGLAGAGLGLSMAGALGVSAATGAAIGGGAGLLLALI